MNQFKKLALRVVETGTAITGLGLMTMGNAHAVFTVPTEVTEAATNVALVGAAVFAIAVAVKLYKWLKGSL